ncbi:hypothetical protein L0222_32730 [bacterium]|nr:hypothetical protein [bacterium]MCI0603474.1 hypothetical protein [bacterium]
MGDIKSVGGSVPPPSTQSVNNTGSAQTQQNQSAATGAGPGSPEPRISDRDAAQRRTEHGIEGVARQAQLQGSTPPGADTGGILRSARNAGLNQQEVQRLETRLNSMTPETRAAEMRFINQNVFGTPNSDRALRTYLDVREQQDRYPSRISDSMVHTLTRAVAEPRSQTRNGLEGVMSHQQALNTAVALTLMPEEHHARLQQTLDRAATRNGQPIPGGDPHYERALILKSLGARTGRLMETDSGPYNPTGPLPPTSSYIQEIEQFSDMMRGQNRNELLRRTTFTDIQGSGGGLQQVFRNSCAPTTAQIARAEADPIYAMSAHRNPAMVITQQQIQLERGGGVAVLRGESGGRGMAIDNVLNTQVSPYTGQNYVNRTVGNSDSARRAALDQMAENLRAGTDVPMRVEWSSTSAHFVLATDVRGTGNNRDFFITDPWTGSSRWYSQAELASGRTTFPGTDTGRLSDIYVPQQ